MMVDAMGGAILHDPLPHPFPTNEEDLRRRAETPPHGMTAAAANRILAPVRT
jgi:hypothetical protein